jgi:hypothetical protein
MRQPKGKQAERKRIEAAALEYGDARIVGHKTRKAIPPDSYEDLLVSDVRGQAWARANR